jgi:hypothetical protein
VTVLLLVLFCLVLGGMAGNAVYQVWMYRRGK